MKTKHVVIIVILLIGLLFSVYVLTISIFNDEWNTVAASLAVTTAIIGSWSAQRIIWKQEEELEPKLSAYLDLKSRKGVTFFVIENTGGSTAFNVKIIWEKPLLNRQDEEIHFLSGEKNIDFRRISKGQKISYFVNATSELYKNSDSNSTPLEFFGEFKYKKKSKSLFETVDDFFVSLEPYRKSLSTEDELQEFLHEGSKIHKDLININNTLEKLHGLLESKPTTKIIQK